MLIQRRNLFGVFRSVWCTSRPTLTTKHIAPGVRRGAQQTPDRHLSQAGLTPSLRLGRVPLALRADCGGVSAVSAVMQERGTFTATQCGHRCQVLVLAGPEFSKGTVAADLLPQYLSAIGCRHTDSCPDLLCAVAFWLRLRSLLRLLPGACERMSMWRLPWEKSGFSTSRLRNILSDTLTRLNRRPPPGRKWTLHCIRAGSASECNALGIPTGMSRIWRQGGWTPKSDAPSKKCIDPSCPPSTAGRSFFDWLTPDGHLRRLGAA